MTVVRIHQVPSLRQRVSEEEWQARVDLAACYRLVSHYGWDDVIYNHSSMRVAARMAISRQRTSAT